MKKFIFLFLLILGINVYADQTFVNESAILEEVYYGVPINVEVVEHDTPTDYYVSVGEGGNWHTITNTFGWGETQPNNRIITWTADQLYTNVRLGIHSGDRNSGTFSVLPTDVSDATFTVLGSSATFSQPDEIYIDGTFELKWKAIATKLPSNLLLEYKTTSGSWTKLADVSNIQTNYTLVNDFIEEDVTFRLTYNGGGYGYNIGHINSSYVLPSMTVTNESYIENNLWGDGQNILFQLQAANVGNLNYVVVYENGTAIDTLAHNELNSYLYSTTPNTDANVTLTFKTKRGLLLATVNVSSADKWLELEPITDDQYTVNSVIPFDWSVSNHFDLISIYVSRNSGNFELINLNWDVRNNYNYAVRSGDTTLTFKFVVTDGVTTLEEYIRDIRITGHCREEELLQEIDNKNREIAFLRSGIDTLNATIREKNALIDSLSSLEPTYIISVLIKDIPNNVETEINENSSNIETLTINNGQILLNNYQSYQYVFIINVNGDSVYEVSGVDIEQNIQVDNLAAGIYFVICTDSVGNEELFKFIK